MVLSSMIPESSASWHNEMLPWDKNRPLTWDDFQGEIDYSDDSASAYRTLIWYESLFVEKVGSGCNYIFNQDMHATAVFDKDVSWAKENSRDRLNLQYYQVLFNIEEVHAQKFKNELLNNTFPCPDGVYDIDKIQEKINESFDKINAESIAMRDLFVSESNYGSNVMKHFEW